MKIFIKLEKLILFKPFYTRLIFEEMNMFFISMKHMAWNKSSRSIRTPSFWGYPPPPHDYPFPLSHIGSQVKRWHSESYKFKKFAKISNFWILKRALPVSDLKLNEIQASRACNFVNFQARLESSRPHKSLCQQSCCQRIWNSTF